MPQFSVLFIYQNHSQKTWNLFIVSWISLCYFDYHMTIGHTLKWQAWPCNNIKQLGYVSDTELRRFWTEYKMFVIFTRTISLQSKTCNIKNSQEGEISIEIYIAEYPSSLLGVQHLFQSCLPLRTHLAIYSTEQLMKCYYQYMLEHSTV